MSVLKSKNTKHKKISSTFLAFVSPSLEGMGMPPGEIVSVMLAGGHDFHLHSIWQTPGALPVDGDPVRIPIAYLIDYAIFGPEFADEAFDYFVNLGPLTRIEVPRGEQ